MKEAFEKVQIEIIELGKEDVIATSNDTLPEIPLYSFAPEKTHMDI